MHARRGQRTVDAYRLAPGASPGPVPGEAAAAGPEFYGFEFAAGLPGFEGAVAALTAEGAAGEADAAAAAAAVYLAQQCHESLADFKLRHEWEPSLLPAVETALRDMADLATPRLDDLQRRLYAMARLKELARSGIHFCQGLDLEPYGSFVSGLYTPSGDLDLSIEGAASWRDGAGRLYRVTVDEMERDMKIKFLRALASRIQGKQLCRGGVDRILHARVPILKFVDTSGLDFDVGIGGSHALFKSTALGLLAQHEWRFGALVRLVKLWARRHGVNDAANGTLNSFALTLLVVFHLQTRSPPVLPPLCEVFGGAPGGPRPMQEQRYPDWHLLTEAGRRLSARGAAGGGGGGNSETLLELLASFFALYQGLVLGGWAEAQGRDAEALRCVLRRVRIDTWAGRLRYERWDRDGYCASVEDPFDSTDNCGRTLRQQPKVDAVAHAAAAARAALLSLGDAAGAEAALHAALGPALPPGALRGLLAGNGATRAVQWIPPVDLIIPPRIQRFTAGCIPPAVTVDHRRPRGAAPAAQHDAAPAAVAQQLRGLALGGGGGGAPPGLAPSAAPPVLAPGAPAPGAPPPPTANLQLLRQAMEPEVAEEAAKLAEARRLAEESGAAAAAARKERKAAKQAAAKALQAARAVERQAAPRGHGGSGSRSRSRPRGRGSRSRSRPRGRGSRSRSRGSSGGPGSVRVRAASTAVAVGMGVAGSDAAPSNGAVLVAPRRPRQPVRQPSTLAAGGEAAAPPPGLASGRGAQQQQQQPPQQQGGGGPGGGRGRGRGAGRRGPPAGEGGPGSRPATAPAGGGGREERGRVLAAPRPGSARAPRPPPPPPLV